MKKLKIVTFSLIFLIIHLYSGVFSQEVQGVLTPDQIYASEEFDEEEFGPAFWLEDGSGFTTLEPSIDENDVVDIIKYNPKTGERSVLISSSHLIPTGQDTALWVEEYSWSPDGRKLLLFTNTQRVWRYNTRGDYWVLDLDTWELFQLGKQAPESSLMFAKISPDGKKAAYVSVHNIFVEDLQTHKVTQITHDGSRELINGTFDWVYEEEFYCRDGFRWSPDSRKIAYWQLDASGVKDFYMINNTDSLYSYIIPVQYPKAGETLSSCRVGVISAEGGETTWMKTEGDPRNNYIPRMEWAANSEEVIIQYLNRHQNTNHVYLGSSQTGELQEILTEKDAAWLDPVDDVKWMQNGTYFTWISERTGWNHIYLVSRDGRDIKPITSGKFDVISIENIDEKGGYVYYIASPSNATQRYLYRMSLKGKGQPELLSPAEMAGTHSYQISPDSRYAIHTYSSFETPTVIDVVSLPKHKHLNMLVSNEKLRARYAEVKKSPVEFFQVTIDENVTIDGWMLKPLNFDPSEKYPVLFYVYGEPMTQTVLDRWRGSNVWHLMIAQQGYIVISMDTRGTPAPKGRDWRKACYMKMGVLNSYEQVQAAKEVAKWDFIDPDRFAIWGWSGGGTSTLNAMFRYPEIYKTGMAVAPVGDLHLYDAIYQERYMRTPQEAPKEYMECSAVNYAQNLQGNLLIVHGTGDDNVHYQGTERVINELIKYNKPFTMMAYPNRSHSIYEGENTTLHLRTLLMNYLKSNLPAGAK